MTVYPRRHSPVLGVLPLGGAILAFVFLACAPAATPEPGNMSGPRLTQAGEPTQKPTSPGGSPRCQPPEDGHNGADPLPGDGAACLRRNADNTTQTDAASRASPWGAV